MIRKEYTSSGLLFRLLYIGIFFLSFWTPSTVQAQFSDQEKDLRKDFKSRLYFGGGFGLQFGSVTLIELSPLVGYKVTPKLSFGLSPTYKFYKFRDSYYSSGYQKTNVFGGSVFGRYMIFQGIFAHAEYETLFYNTVVPGYPRDMQQYNSMFVGGGYQQNIGGNAGMYALVLWNLNDQMNSPYSNPVIRIGFNVGL
jgi:hypothetical protein